MIFLSYIRLYVRNIKGSDIIKENDFYSEMFENSPFGYAYHKIITDEKNTPIDFEFLKVNNTYKKIMGLENKNIINKKLTEIIPNISHEGFDFMKLPRNIAIDKKEDIFDQYSHNLNKWFKGYIYSSKTYYFSVFLFESKIENKIANFSRDLLKYNTSNINYNTICNNLNELSNSNYCFLILLENNKKSKIINTNTSNDDFIDEMITLFNTESSLIKEIINFNKKIISYDNLDDFFRFSIKNLYTSPIYKSITKYEIGEILILKLGKDNNSIGFFILFFKKNNFITNRSLVESYSDLVGMTINRIYYEKEIETKDKKLSLAQTFAKGGTWEYNIENKNFSMSKELEILFGYNHNELNHSFENLLNIIHFDDKDKFLEIMNNIKFHLKNHSYLKPIDFEHRIINKQGKTIWVRQYIGFNDYENNYDIVSFTLEITENKKKQILLNNMNKELANSNIAKKSFLSRVSHELKTPMIGILGGIDLISKSDSIEKIQSYTKMLSDSANQLMPLIENIVDISKLESSQMDIYLETFDINDLLLEIVKIYENKANNKNLDFFFINKINKNTLIYTDEIKLRKILSNILNNAIEFTNDGFVEISSEIELTETNKVIIKFVVKDTGIGIKKEFHNKIFNSFEQDENYLKRKHQGLGLGLSLAKEFISLLNGKISFISEENQGTTFFFNIEATKIEENKKNIKILSVDDDNIERLILKSIFEKEDFSLTVVENAHKLIELYKNNEYDIILMDLQMPELDGIQATKIIRDLESNTKKRIPIIAITGHTYEIFKEECMRAGVDDYIMKPYNIDELILKIKKYTS